MQTQAEQLELLKWHLERYDHLRSSTTNRASTVLAAGSILSTGNAVMLAQLLLGFGGPARTWLLAAFSVAVVISSILVVVALGRATRVLVTRRSSRQLFARATEIPLSMVFNGTDTVAHIPTFAAFQEVLERETIDDVILAARVELWMVINQHRLRYRYLRSAIRALSYAAVAFVAILIAIVVSNLATNFIQV